MSTHVASRRVLELTPEWRRPVVRVPLTQAFPQLEEIKEFKSKVCLFNEDRSRVFDVVSPRYQLVEHGQAYDRIDTALQKFFGKPVTANVRSINNGARIRAEFKLPIAVINIGGAHDVNEITLLMRNSYDRSFVFSATLGAFRLICTNGMKIGETFGEIKARHIGAESQDDSHILESLDLMISNAPKLKRLWEEWFDTKVELPEAQALLEPARFPAKYIDPVLKEDRFPRTKWDLYNDLTNFATHHTRSVSRRMEFDDVIAKLFYGGEIANLETTADTSERKPSISKGAIAPFYFV